MHSTLASIPLGPSLQAHYRPRGFEMAALDKTDVAGGPAPRLTRCALKLSEYNFEVEHKPGANHSDADAISRLVAAITRSPTAAQSLELMGDLPAQKIREATSAAKRLKAKDRASRTALDTKESIPTAYLDVSVPAGDVFRRELDADAFARDIMDFLLVKLPADDPATADSLSQDEKISFKIMNGLLYYLSVADSDDPATLRLYAPSSLRHSYLVAFHDSAGHMGVDRVCRLRA
jgi:hypothetical protein